MQARADYALLLKLIHDADVPNFQRLHYLQMTTEKLAKGFLTPPGAGRYPNTHDAFARFLTVAKGRREIKAASRFTRSEQFIAYMDSLRPLAQAVENLSPEGGDHPNPEYPWEANGVIIAPTEYAFSELDFRSPKMQKLLAFIADCFSVIESG